MDDAASPKTENLADRAFDELSAAILSGDIPTGSKLSEPLLARKLGLSRGPLREAIRRLQERQLVTRSPRLGARVIVPDTQSVSEVYAVREVLEGLAAREAARNMTDEKAKALFAILAAHAKQLEVNFGRYGFANLDHDFHVAICNFSGNQRLIRLLCGEYYQIIRLYRSKHAAEPSRAGRALFEHQRIAQALADRDEDLAELLMRRHIQASRRNIQSILEKGEVGRGARRSKTK